MTGIIGLGYLGFGVSDLGAWRHFAEGVLGLQIAGRSSDGGLLLRMDDCARRFVLYERSDDDILFAGWQVARSEDLDAVGTRLVAAGIEVARGTPEEAGARGVRGLLRFSDPDGLQTEIFYGPEMAVDAPFRSTNVSGFVTGDQGLGHIVLGVGDVQRSAAFYRDVLGFGLSDTITFNAGPTFIVDLSFFHCNTRHHSLAFGPRELGPKRLLHFMVQVASIDDLGFAHERVTRDGVNIIMSLGRHSNDEMLSFYAQTPSGFEVEIGWGARIVNPSTWSVEHHWTTSKWGHHRNFGPPS